MENGDLSRRNRGRSTLMTAGVTVAAAALGLATSAVHGQFESENVELLSQVTLSQFGTGADNGNDCWGYVSATGREYALMGLSNALGVVEITDPRNPVVVGTVPHTNSLWGDVKIFRDYAYVSNESGGGIDIIDLSEVDNGIVTLVRRFVGNSVRTSHNVALNEESGYLYLCGANISGGRLVAFDLNANPELPVYAGAAGGAYVHDAHIVTYKSGPYAGREIAFCADGGDGLQIWDVTNKASMVMLGATTYPGLSYCHQCWTSDDLQYLFVDDELDELEGRTPTTRTLVFDISDLSNPTLATTFTSGLPASDHNLYVRDGIVYEANYNSGLRIFDATDPMNAVQIGWFDTYPSSNGAGFNGAWSCFPFFPSGTVIVSDMQRGLFVLDVTNAISGLSFSFPGGHPDLVSPDGGTVLDVEITARNATLEPGSAMLHVDTGAGFTPFPLNDLGGGQFSAAFPASDCGETVHYYVSAETTDNRMFTSPGGAPENAYETLSAFGIEYALQDNFETDLGWTVQNIAVTDGGWERGVPQGNNGQRGDPVDDYDGSGRCYVTGNSFESDLDGGPTVLTSPTIDVQRADALVQYAAWFTNDDGDDRMLVDVSNDDGANWIRMETIAATAGWELHELPIADFVAPTATMKFRFTVSDNPNDSVTEGGIDAFAIAAPQCGPQFILEADPLFAGQNATLRVSGATALERVYFVYSLRGVGNTFVPALNVTLGLDRPTLAGSSIADANGAAEFAQMIPNIGTPRLVWLQAAQFERVSNVLTEQVN